MSTPDVNPLYGNPFKLQNNLHFHWSYLNLMLSKFPNSSKVSVNLAKHVFTTSVTGAAAALLYLLHNKPANCTNVAQQFLGFVTRPPISWKSGKNTMSANYLPFLVTSATCSSKIDMVSSQAHDISHPCGRLMCMNRWMNGSLHSSATSSIRWADVISERGDPTFNVNSAEWNRYITDLISVF